MGWVRHCVLGMLGAAFAVLPATAFAQQGIQIPLHVESIQSNPAATPAGSRLNPFEIDPRSARARANAFDNDPIAKRIERGQALADRAGLQCRVSDSIALGLTPDDHEVREVACDAGPGYMLTSTPQPSSLNCIVLAKARTPDMSATVPECVLPSNLDAATAVGRMVQTASAGCVVRAADWLAGTSREDFYEAKCDDGRGVVVRVARLGGGIRVQSCVSALRIGIECRMTDARQQALALRDRHFSLVDAAGFTCREPRDRFVGEEQGGRRREVLELGCANHGLGLVAFLATGTDDGTEVMDCISATARGVDCALTSREDMHQSLSRQVDAVEPGCQVTAFTVGRMSADGAGEHARLTCSDGRIVQVVLPFRRSVSASSV